MKFFNITTFTIPLYYAVIKISHLIIVYSIGCYIVITIQNPEFFQTGFLLHVGMQLSSWHRLGYYFDSHCSSNELFKMLIIKEKYTVDHDYFKSIFDEHRTNHWMLFCICPPNTELQLFPILVVCIKAYHIKCEFAITWCMPW